MTTGTRLVVVVLGAATLVAVLRFLCVPVGSFRAGLDELAWGMSADSVRAILGPPNEICASAAVDHLGAGPDSTGALARVTSERWVYTERPPDSPVPRSEDPACRAPFTATELGFDRSGRLAWRVREMAQTGVEMRPDLLRGEELDVPPRTTSGR